MKNQHYWIMSAHDGSDGMRRIGVTIDADDCEFEFMKRPHVGPIDNWIPKNASCNFIGSDIDDCPVCANPYVEVLVSSRFKSFLEKEVPGLCQFLELSMSKSGKFEFDPVDCWVLFCLQEVDIINLHASQEDLDGCTWIPEPIIDREAAAQCEIPIGRLKNLLWTIVVKDELREKIEKQKFVGVNFQSFRYIS